MLTQRSNEKELLDLGPDYYTQEEYLHCQKMLFRVNQFFGFFKTVMPLLKKLPRDAKILDVGCGGGLFLLHLSRYFPHMQMLGVDISSEAIAVAAEALQDWQKSYPNTQVTFQLLQQPSLLLPKNSFDLVLSTLVCHHLTDDQIVEFFIKAHETARVCVVINDLHRHFLASFLYRIVSPILFRNRLITHDGLISIRRGFTRAELILLLQKAQIKNYRLQWCFPFRWRIVLWQD